jgi:DNA-binding FrmR family transcriptional regulator
MAKSHVEMMHGIKQDEKKALLSRMARIEGQVRGIRDMIEREEDCERIAQQLSAARGALQKAFSQMMACAIKHQLFDENKFDETESEQLEKLTQVISKYS